MYIKLEHLKDNARRAVIRPWQEEFIKSNNQNMLPQKIANELKLSYSCVYSYMKRNHIPRLKGQMKRVPVQYKSNGYFDERVYAKQTVTI